MDTLTIRLSTCDDEAATPRYAYKGDAGVDLCSMESLTLKPFQRVLVSTGLQMAIPDGYAGFVLPRSGLSSKHGITVINSPGLIDSNYRGEIKVPLLNLDSDRAFTIEKGDRIAQLVIMRVAEVDFVECESLDSTERGSGGFGSSGIAHNE